MKSELGLRVVSAVVLLAIVLPLTWLGGIWFFAMCVALSGVLFYECWNILNSGNDDGPPRSNAWLVVAFIYAAIPVLCLPPIRNNVMPDGLYLLLLLFVVVWVTDIAAYFAGRHFGGPKLLPAVSPKKTWSGALGGLLGAVMVAAWLGWAIEVFSAVWCALGAVLLSVFSQAGDLLESWAKRRFNVKDSSNLIPGHGGFLDRVDGLLAAALPMTIYVLLTAN